MTTAATSEPHGVLVVDKARGPTSHDVVAVARRVLGTKAIGHTGTLDPMATGVLVLAVGEATKLVNLLGASHKQYEATLTLGVATHSLDADGDVTEQAEVPELCLADVQRAASQFIGEFDQEVPQVSAVKIGGRPMHELARKGREVVAPVRRVIVHELSVHEFTGRDIRFSVRCDKGFYVRSLARDWAVALGTVGHLSALRRTHNGKFELGQAVDFEELRAAGRGTLEQRQAVRERLVPLTTVCRALPNLRVDDVGAEHARHGRPIPLSCVQADLDALAESEPHIAFDGLGRLLAIVERSGDACRILRGFRAL